MYCLSDIQFRLGAVYFSLPNLATLFPVELGPRCHGSTHSNASPLNWIYVFPDDSF